MASSNLRVSWVGVSVFVVIVMFLCHNNVSSALAEEADEEEEHDEEHVLTLDHSNFTDIVSKHHFIVVEFYAPWCGHCQKLAPEYEEAASVLSSNDPPLILAKVDASAEENKQLVIKYEVQGFPTIKIFRNGGKDIQEYKGPREASGIVPYLKKQSGPASAQINNADDVKSFIDENRIVVVGIFSDFSGEEFENFTVLAEKLQSDYDFCHTLDAKLLPRGESSLSKPTVRLLKPFDELVLDIQEFEVDSLVKFVEESSVPTVTVYDKDPNNLPFVVKFFSSPDSKAILLANFNDKHVDALKSAFKDVAVAYKRKGMSFLLGELEASQGLIQFFGLKNEQVPLILIQTNDGKKFFKPNLVAGEITCWFNEYMDGKVKPFVKSEPIPEINDKPVKVVVADSLKNMVFESGKNVLLEFYAPWCGHCQKLAPILDEVAVSFANDPQILIAKLDATSNDFPSETFEVKGLPTMYFKSSSGSILQYNGDRTKDDIIDFIEKNRDIVAQAGSDEVSTAVKDEL